MTNLLSRFGASLALSCCFFAAPAHAAQEDFGAWIGATATINVGKKAVFFIEEQTRLSNNASHINQQQLRTAMGYKLDKTTTVFLGYVYSPSFPIGGVDTHEHRIYQQLSFRILGDGKGLTLSGRTRFEQRFRTDRSDMGWRLRQQLRLTAPISSKSKVQAVVTTEPFIGLNETTWGQASGLSAWRNFVGISVPVGKHFKIEPGYIQNYTVRSARDRLDHVAALTINSTF